jgi:TIR domain-containing protein
MSAEVPTIFISHISEEEELAGILKRHLMADFGGRVRVFVSSDLESIAAGRNWLKSVHTALDEASVELILCSRLSISRPWVNFELGAAWLKNIPIVPVCHSGFAPSDLPMPYGVLQSIEVGKERQLEKLYRALVETVGVDVTQIDFGELADEVRAFESAYTIKVRMKGQGGSLLDLTQGERLVGKWAGKGFDLEVPPYLAYQKKLTYDLSLELRRRQSIIGGEFHVRTFERERTDMAFIELINISGDYFYFKYWVAIPNANHCGFMIMQLSPLGDELEGMFLTTKLFERQIGLGKIVYRRQ